MKNPILRLITILVVVILLLVLSKFTALGAWFNMENITSFIKSTGPWGFLMFSVLFILGSFLQVPAMLFVLIAILIYGPFDGAILGYVGVIIAMSVNYLVIRTIGSNVLNEFKNKHAQKILSKLDSSPIRTIIILRLIFWASPVLNYTLAMTNVEPKQYIVGSSIGIILPIIFFTGAVYFFEEIIIPIVIQT
jgi:uncharacterized membrane protein YdjX (TVP38/TMEM64 family)